MNKKKVLDFNINLNQNQIRILLITIIILVIILLFRKQFSTTLEKIIVFTIIFILLLIISKNIIVTIIGTSLIFLLINLIIQYRNTIENFENSDEKDEKKDDKDDKDNKDENKLNLDANVFNNPDYLSAKGGLDDLVKQLDGGIKLSDTDTKETPKLDIDSTKYSKNNNNALQKAQIESYELINTIKTLQDTLQTLSPVLGEGKKLMSAFESLQF